MYKIVLTQSALKDLEKIDQQTKLRIGIKLKSLTDDPLTKSKKLSNHILGSYRFRIGDYRVIFDVEGDKIIILKIGHRKDIYK